MAEAIDKDRVDQIGEELRRSASPSPAAFDALSEWRNAHLPALENVVTGIQESLHINCGARVKTPGTIIEKLKRIQRLKLSEIQDIAGARIVLPVTLPEQDAWCRRITELFEQDGKWHDRRDKPSHGYRALHVVLSVDGFQIEVQFRTEFQAVWAHLVERYAGVYGRQIQYGKPPQQPEIPGVLPAEGVSPLPIPTRSEIAAALGQLSTYIAQVEDMRASIFRAEVDLYAGRSAFHGNVLTQAMIKQIRETALQSLSSLKEPCHTHEETLRHMLGRLARLEPC